MSIGSIFSRLLLTFTAITLVAGSSSLAATRTVQVGAGGTIFVPATTNIALNDTVLWNWAGLNHSTTSDTGLWDSMTFNAPHTFSFTFTNAGTFPYHCTPHLAFGMVGSIVVTGPPSPPSVTITNPPNNITLAQPASFTLAASASDSDGSVTNVQFLQGSSNLGNDNTSPFSFPVNNLTPGDYIFSAVASDNSGMKATNSITVHVVDPVPITLSAPERLSATSFRFNYSANVGLRYVVERSLDLFSWSALNTNTAASDPVVFTDNAATGDPGYYRVGRLPNP